MRVRTKICGITCVEDALFALECGADALGFVFYEPSPRYVSIETAKYICEKLPPFVTIVGLFVDASQDQIERTCADVPLTLLQFHGNENELECSSYSIPYIKAVRIRTSDDVSRAEVEYASSKAILVDTYKKGVPGGTGERFDWGLLPPEPSKPIILAGGLEPDNIYNAIQEVRPYAVDVSGGVELEKGIKDHEKISRFIKEVSRASEYTYN